MARRITTICLILCLLILGRALSCSGSLNYRCTDEEKCASTGEERTLALNSVSPDRGSSAGGTVITLTGSGFETGISVTVGEGSCSAINVISQNSLTCTTPAGAAGLVSIQVAISGKAPASLQNAFTYVQTRTWVTMTTTSAPQARTEFAAVGGGEKLFVWGGLDNTGAVLNNGGVFDAKTKTWTATSGVTAPTARRYATAVWAGGKVIVFGGSDAGTYLSNGGIYDVENNSWAPLSATGSPSMRAQHCAVWTGSKMIVWGGHNGTAPLSTGDIYDHVASTWDATPVNANTPGARHSPQALWTGTKMLIFGGRAQNNFSSVGGAFDPSANSWTKTPELNAPEGRTGFAFVWTGTNALVWGGWGSNREVLSDGKSFDLSTWESLPAPHPSVLSARGEVIGVWTGSKLLVWGGQNGESALNNGALYDPQSQTWEAIPNSLSNTPSARYSHAGIWTGAELVIWGGEDGLSALNSGGLFTWAELEKRLHDSVIR